MTTTPTPFDAFDIEEMARAVRGLTKTVARATREHPYIALAAAAGAGFVLAGGLRSPTGRGLLALAARFALPHVESAVMAVVARVQDPAPEPSPDAAPADMAAD